MCESQQTHFCVERKKRKENTVSKLLSLSVVFYLKMSKKRTFVSDKRYTIKKESFFF